MKSTLATNCLTRSVYERRHNDCNRLERNIAGRAHDGMKEGGIMRFNRGSILFALLSFVLIFGLLTPGWAQQVTASITGKVTDPSGAPVPGAKVTATDTERGTKYTGAS